MSVTIVCTRLSRADVCGKRREIDRRRDHKSTVIAATSRRLVAICTDLSRGYKRAPIIIARAYNVITTAETCGHGTRDPTRECESF